MLAIKQEISHKRQRTQWFQHLRPFNQNELEVRMTNSQYSSIIWLTQGKYAIVDNSDYEWLSQWKWYYNGRYARRILKQRIIYMHRIVMNTPREMFTDHINGLGVDNRKQNLRICGNAGNARNRAVNVAKFSGFKGVSWHKRTKNWQSRIRFNGELFHLGSYKNPVEAALVYNEAAVKYHGEFARLNEIKEKI